MLTRIHLRQKPGEMLEGPENGFSVSPESETAAGTPRILSTRQHLYTMLQRQLLLANKYLCAPLTSQPPFVFGEPCGCSAMCHFKDKE